MVSLYIHIPFCKRLCPYCAFYKLVTQPDTVDRFLAALYREMAAYLNTEGRLKIETVYVGGGTPSELPMSAWAGLVQRLNDCFDLSSVQEFTVELNPESVTPNYVSELKALGVNRLSLGVQSMRRDELRFLGRAHTPEQVQRAAEAIHQAGIENWSSDLIYALPGSTTETVMESLHAMTQLGPTHISVYELTIEPNTKFERRRVQVSPDVHQLAQYGAIQNHLNQIGFHQYEFSAFARPGNESCHNQAYWLFKPYIGIGPGAHSFYKGARYANEGPFEKYLNREFSDISRQFGTPDPTQDLLTDLVMVQLRMVSGIDITQVRAQFGIDILEEYRKPLQKLVDEGFLAIRDGRIWATQKGWPLIDQLAIELLTYSS